MQLCWSQRRPGLPLLIETTSQLEAKSQQQHWYSFQRVDFAMLRQEISLGRVKSWREMAMRRPAAVRIRADAYDSELSSPPCLSTHAARMTSGPISPAQPQPPTRVLAESRMSDNGIR